MSGERARWLHVSEVELLRMWGREVRRVNHERQRSTVEILATAPPRPKKHHTKSGGTRSEWDRWLAKNLDELVAARRLEPSCVRTDGTNRWEAQCPECGGWSPVVCDKRTALQAIESCRHGATS